MERKQGLYEKYIKRFFDISCAIAAIVVFWWLYLIVAVLVRVNLGSPIIFKQPRPGKNGKIFVLYKFRTMTNERDENNNLLPDGLRITKFGKALRKSSMDELPEVVNILNGTMSVVGPRPQLVKDMVFMTEEQRARHSVKPGLSGLAQTKGRNTLEWDKKLETDIEYVKNITFLGDMKIIFNTIRQVFFHQNGGDDSFANEVEITDDYGDYLLKKGRITCEEYEEKQQAAMDLLGDW